MCKKKAFANLKEFGRKIARLKQEKLIRFLKDETGQRAIEELAFGDIDQVDNQFTAHHRILEIERGACSALTLVWLRAMFNKVRLIDKVRKTQGAVDAEYLFASRRPANHQIVALFRDTDIVKLQVEFRHIYEVNQDALLRMIWKQKLEKSFSLSIKTAKQYNSGSMIKDDDPAAIMSRYWMSIPLNGDIDKSKLPSSKLKVYNALSEIEGFTWLPCMIAFALCEIQIDCKISRGLFIGLSLSRNGTICGGHAVGFFRYPADTKYLFFFDPNVGVYLIHQPWSDESDDVLNFFCFFEAYDQAYKELGYDVCLKLGFEVRDFMPST